MLTANNNQDILFDDMSLMNSTRQSGTSADKAIQYGDCGNRFEIETSHTHPNKSNSKPLVIAYGDCGN